MRLLCAKDRRCALALRPGWRAKASSNAPTWCAGKACLVGWSPFEHAPAGAGVVDPENDPHRRALAGAVGPQDPCHTARPDLEGQTVAGSGPAVAFREGIHLDHVLLLPPGSAD